MSGSMTRRNRPGSLSSRASRWSTVLSLVAALILAGVAPVSANHAHRSLPTLYWNDLQGTATWIDTLDPAMVYGGPAYSVSLLIYANLDALSTSGRVQPDITTWRMSKNHRVYWFTIRKGARFSNGDPVTAEDIRYSITRVLLPSTASPNALNQYGDIVGAKAVNAGKTKVVSGINVLNTREVRITLDRPIAYFLALNTWPTGDVLDERVTKRLSNSTITRTCVDTVSSGPFMFVCRNHNHDLSSFYSPGTTPSMTLVPNPHYYGPKAHVRIVMRVLGSTEINYDAFRANEVDATVVPSIDVARERGKSGFAGGPVPEIQFLAPNMDAAPFNNVHCRLAVAYGFNQDTIDNLVLHRTLVPLETLVPRGIAGWYPGNNNPHYNVRKAKAELAQCPGGIHNAKIAYQKTGTDADLEISAMQSQLAQIGINVQPDPLTIGDFTKVSSQPLAKSHVGMAVINWSYEFPDAQQCFDWLLLPGLPYNISDYRNRVVTRLASEADVEGNPRTRSALYIKASHIVASSGGMIMIGQQTGYSVLKPWVHGMFYSAPYYTFEPRGMQWANVSVSRH
jgi:oligopeptide transport system substrate-binding protein